MIARRVNRTQRGIALIEALVAVVLLGVGLLGIIGLQARSYSALSDTAMRAEATIAADKLLGTMATDQANLGSYVLAAGGVARTRLSPWYTETRTNIPNAAIQVAVAPVAGAARTQVTITISWARRAGTAANQHVITAYIANAL
jgi:type IV pilus assembly protein PilV